MPNSLERPARTAEATLREAVAVMRDAWLDHALGSATLAARGIPVGTMAPTMVAVADWLEHVAEREYMEGRGIATADLAHALAVARAYLGESA